MGRSSRHLNERIEEYQATLQSVGASGDGDFYIYDLRDDLDRLIACRDTLALEEPSPEESTLAELEREAQLKEAAVEEARRAAEWLRDYPERERAERAARQREREKEAARQREREEQARIEAQKREMEFRPVARFPRSRYEVQLLEWSLKRQPCTTCRAEAAGVPLPGQPHDEGCPRR